MRASSFNIVHLAMALFVVVVSITLILPALEACRHETRGPARSSQLRGIHQGMVTYGNSNKEYFPGLRPDGSYGVFEPGSITNPTPAEMQVGITVEDRYAILLTGDYFTPEYTISPMETEPLKDWDSAKQPAVTKENYSYAMLQVPEDGGRHAEWGQTLNSQAIVVSDRNTAVSGPATSIHNEAGDKHWRGSVLWNDNHVEFATKGCLFETRYTGGTLNPADHLFEPAGPYDALVVHAGN